MLHVPYRGSGPAVIDVGAGRVDIMFDAVPSLLALIQAGKLRPLAAASAERNPIVPDVPTFGELGIKGMEISLWYGMVGPAGLPPPIVQRLNAELGEDPEDRRGARELSPSRARSPAGGSPQDYADVHARGIGALGRGGAKQQHQDGVSGGSTAPARDTRCSAACRWPTPRGCVML